MTSTSGLAPLHFKIVIDAAAPHTQADFWAAALHYEVEDNSALIEKLLGFGAVTAESTVESHGRRAWRDLAAVRHPDDPVQEESGTGLGRRLQFQRVPDGRCSESTTDKGRPRSELPPSGRGLGPLLSNQERTHAGPYPQTRSRAPG
ncbi:VOC family protein [Streptomyces sp. NPDC048392]|uniref:VOC family protein n=1 Tax=Streptomyces sp. NPDC048392 TaxID=3365543 RepID=UPI00371542C6